METETVISIFAILVTVYVAWRSATTHYYRQRWWDRKAQTYDNIVGALNSIWFTLWEWENEFTHVANVQPEYAAKLTQERQDAIAVVKRLAGASDFLITEATGLALRKAAGSLDSSFHASHPMEGIDSDSKAIQECLAIVKTEAKKDLKL